MNKNKSEDKPKSDNGAYLYYGANEPVSIAMAGKTQCRVAATAARCPCRPCFVTPNRENAERRANGVNGVVDAGKRGLNARRKRRVKRGNETAGTRV